MSISSRVLMLVGVTLAGACSSSSGSSTSAPSTTTTGGHCSTAQSCFFVSSPAGYDLQTECEAVGNKWAAGSCSTTGFVRKCTQKTQVSTNGGAQQDVTYVYYFAAGDPTTCLGTEEPIGTGVGGSAGASGAGGTAGAAGNSGANCTRSMADDGNCGAVVLGVTYGAAWRCVDNAGPSPCDKPFGSVASDGKAIKCCP